MFLKYKLFCLPDLPSNRFCYDVKICGVVNQMESRGLKPIHAAFRIQGLYLIFPLHEMQRIKMVFLTSVRGTQK